MRPQQDSNMGRRLSYGTWHDMLWPRGICIEPQRFCRRPGGCPWHCECDGRIESEQRINRRERVFMIALDTPSEVAREAAWRHHRSRTQLRERDMNNSRGILSKHVPSFRCDMTHGPWTCLYLKNKGIVRVSLLGCK